ncbi:hypothetical protein U9K52_09685 [Chryseobacterium sp. MHB01]|uniref:hypothetical protein n=1 Tax=Chryseobacterium sp. MHB01 TaxID=3109433 RepID=UPI002AFE04F6|nr:hypothetical protein [Chryseobacterium sp. MHB01]MEA1849182.1 hypothetical protein [Chryseobacterium sp. MHB01]
MRYSDFRIGNLVLHATTVTKVVAIHEDGIVVKHSEKYPSAKLTIQGIREIAVDESWFLKFGFAKVRDYPCFRIDGIQIEYDGSSSEWKADLFSGRTSIKFVHQLQNLFFALTGKELTINK